MIRNICFSMNVLILVLDCLRKDAITKQDTPHLYDLATNNLSFERCVTPANWSLPAHASLFTGLWPHEHRYFHREHYIKKLPLIEDFQRRDYTTIGISANIYASSSHGFSNDFDQFYETRRPLNPRGLNPFANVRKIQSDREPRLQDYLQTGIDVLTHEYPFASIENFGRSIALELDRRFDCRSYIPRFPDDKYGFLTKASERTSQMLIDSFDQQSTNKLFAFANYMNTHYPYEPSKKHLKDVANSKYDQESISNLDPDISSPNVFLNEFFGGGVNENTLSKVRSAYTGEVRGVDEQVGEILNDLKYRGLLDDTVIIVTADHGECLGEKDLRGERGMGHLPFLNKHLWRVPLIISNPYINKITVNKRVSLKSLFDLITGDLEKFIRCGGQDYVEYFDGEKVFFELPANPYHKSSWEDFENVPNWYVEREAETHTILGFSGEWRVSANSQGNVSAWKQETTKDVNDAPDELVTMCRDAVNQFPSVQSKTNTKMSEDLEQQLKDLGYA